MLGALDQHDVTRLKHCRHRTITTPELDNPGALDDCVGFILIIDMPSPDPGVGSCSIWRCEDHISPDVRIRSGENTRDRGRLVNLVDRDQGDSYVAEPGDHIWVIVQKSDHVRWSGEV